MITQIKSQLRRSSRVRPLKAEAEARKQKSTDRLLESMGNHWVTYGLLDATGHLDLGGKLLVNHKLTFVATLLQMAKSLGSLCLGWDCRSFQKYSGDFFAPFDSEPIWFYLNLTALVVTIQSVVSPKICRKFWKPDWFEIFSKRQNPASLKLDEVQTKQFRKMSIPVLAFLKCILYLPYVVSTGFALFYLLKYKNMHLLLLAVVWGIQFCIWVIAVANRGIIFPSYLIMFSFYVKYRSQLLSREIRSITETSKRRLLRSVLIGAALEKAVADQTQLVSLVRSCNRLYRHVSAVAVPSIGFPALCVIYAFQHSDDFYVKMLMAYIIATAIVLTSSYFLADGMMNRAFRKSYKTWSGLLAKLPLLGWTLAGKPKKLPKRLFGPRLNQRVHWHLVLTQEYLSAKRNRVGVHCLHWFVLSNFTLVKSLLFFSSIYMYLVEFGKKF